jgi:3-phosphoshikimate 1-carboxyvinyltransferase
MADLVVEPASGLTGEVTPPADKSIAHRALIFGSIAGGPSLVEYSFEGEDGEFVGLGEDNLSTLRIMRQLGAEIEYRGQGRIAVFGLDLDGLREPNDVLDAGNSGTTTRLMAGLLAGQKFFSVLTGDESLRSRPMSRVIVPLRKMCADIRGRKKNKYAPLAIRGKKMHGIEYQMPVASAQLKSCLLLAGLYAEGPTTVIEPSASRNHTELMLRALGANLKSENNRITLTPGNDLFGREFIVPSDISAAAFWLVAGTIVPGCELVIKNVGINKTRDGILQALWRMGAEIEVENSRRAGEEPVADLVVRHSSLHGVEIGGDLIPRLIDEIPALAIAAAFAEGQTVIRDAAELRVKESDRLAAVATGLKALGVEVEELPDGLVIEGGRGLKSGTVDAFGDHRIAMAFAVGGLAANGPVTITGAQSVAISYPTFAATLTRLAKGHGPQGKKRGKPIVTIDGPSGSGKSTLGKMIASRLGFLYIDTGAMYRALGLAVERAGLDPQDREAVERLAGQVRIDLEETPDGLKVGLDGEDVSTAIRQEQIGMYASTVSTHPGVRQVLVDSQRRLGEVGGVVLEGRDTGTVVFPDAEFKFYFDARPEVRAQRRVEQLAGNGGNNEYERVLDEIKKRDLQDSTRDHSPLRVPENARTIDTADLSIDQVAECMLEIIEDKES